MNKNDTIEMLEKQARNTKYLMDELNSAYIGLTTEEILKLALYGRKNEDDRDDDNGEGDGIT